MKSHYLILFLIIGAFLGWVLIDVDHIFTRLYFHIQYTVFLIFGMWVGWAIRLIIQRDNKC